MATYYVYSTLATGMDYTNHVATHDLPRVVAKVTINGGAGVADKNLVTPLGGVTEITEEKLEQLRLNPVFQMHEKNGFVKVDDRRRDVEVAVADLQARDESAPAIPEDFAEEGLEISVGKSKVKGK